MPSFVLSPGEAHVPDDTDQSPPRYEGKKTVLPDFIQFGKKHFVVFDVSHLSLGIPVLLERPIRRGRDYEVNRGRCEFPHCTRIPKMDRVLGGNTADCIFDERDKPFVLGDTGNVGLGIVQGEDIVGDEGSQIRGFAGCLGFCHLRRI